MTNDRVPPTRYALVKGAFYRSPDIRQYVEMLEPGSPLMLEREPENPYDANAVKVLDPDSELHLGYINKELAELLAFDMDNGWYFTCVVTELVPGPKVVYPKVRIEPVIPNEEEVVAETDEPVHAP
jgi:hypothetical protein